jgi:hypothetical protein
VFVATFQLYLEKIGGSSLLLDVARELGSWIFPHVVSLEARGLLPVEAGKQRKLVIPMNVILKDI